MSCDCTHLHSMAFSNDGKDEGRPLRNDCIPPSASRAVPEERERKGERKGGRGGRGEGGRQCRVSVAIATTGILLTLYDINNSHTH